MKFVKIIVLSMFYLLLFGCVSHFEWEAKLVSEPVLKPTFHTPKYITIKDVPTQKNGFLLYNESQDIIFIDFEKSVLVHKAQSYRVYSDSQTNLIPIAPNTSANIEFTTPYYTINGAIRNRGDYKVILVINIDKKPMKATIVVPPPNDGMSWDGYSVSAIYPDEFKERILPETHFYTEPDSFKIKPDSDDKKKAFAIAKDKYKDKLESVICVGVKLGFQ